jgi:putative hydrolase of the HAD superfamily
MPLNLLIDADDTLWENNIYFERAFDEFVSYLDHSTLSPVEVRDVLDEIERVNSKVHGYGSKNFGRNLVQCYQHLVEHNISESTAHTITGFAERILEQPLEIIKGVPETLEYLASRHSLTLFTKGNPEEQKLKIDSSGLACFFQHTAIVKEKDITAYRLFCAGQKLSPAGTWMIGNSPKSDINPALAAGMNAVFIPHARTWILEREEIKAGGQPGQFLQLENFCELTARF